MIQTVNAKCCDLSGVKRQPWECFYPSQITRKNKTTTNFYFSCIRSQLDSSMVCITTTLSVLLCSDLHSGALHYKLTPRICKYKHSEALWEGYRTATDLYSTVLRDQAGFPACQSSCNHVLMLPLRKLKHLRKADRVLTFHNAVSPAFLSTSATISAAG